MKHNFQTRYKLWFIVCAIAFLFNSSSGWSQQDDQEPKDAAAKQRTAEIFRFIRKQIPELEEPLKALRRKNPDQFSQAMQSLNDSYERLQNLKKSGNETAYKRALENWTFNATIQMLTAQLSVEPTGRLKRELQRVLKKQNAARLHYLISERDRLNERLEQLNQSIERMERDRDDNLQRRFESIIRAAERKRRALQNESP